MQLLKYLFTTQTNYDKTDSCYVPHRTYDVYIRSYLNINWISQDMVEITITEQNYDTYDTKKVAIETRTKYLEFIHSFFSVFNKYEKITSYVNENRRKITFFYKCKIELKINTPEKIREQILIPFLQKHIDEINKGSNEHNYYIDTTDLILNQRQWDNFKQIKEFFTNYK